MLLVFEFGDNFEKNCDYDWIWRDKFLSTDGDEDPNPSLKQG